MSRRDRRRVDPLIDEGLGAVAIVERLKADHITAIQTPTVNEVRGRMSYLARGGIRTNSLFLAVLIVLVATTMVDMGPVSAVDLGQGFENIRDVEFSPNSTLLAQGRQDGWLEIWDMDTQQQITRFQAHANSIQEVSWSPNGSYLATGSSDSEVRVWNTSTWDMVARIQKHINTVFSVKFSPDGSVLASGAAGSWTLSLWNTSDWSEIQSFNNISTPLDIEFAPDGTQLWTSSNNAKITMFDTQTWSEIGNFTSSPNIRDFDFSPDGQWMATARYGSGVVNIYEPGSMNLVQNLSVMQNEVFEVSFASNSSMLAVGGMDTDGVVSLWNVSTWTWTTNLSAPGCYSYGLDFSSDGDMLATGWCDDARVWISDNDGDGLRNVKDDCPDQWGNSTEDLQGCQDLDGDGWSNGADDFPMDPSQWLDSDGDGYGDNPGGTDPDACPLEAGNSTWPGLGCPDADGDGYSDTSDAFPSDPSEWSDQDSDGIGDNSDDCPSVAGNSTLGHIGCTDADGDSWADSDDAFPQDPNEWSDADSDGVGDNADQCPSQAGTSTEDRVGCPDFDQDGWSDQGDQFPDDPNEWVDSDADEIGDNADGCPLEAGNSTQPDIGCPDGDQDGWADRNDSCPLVPGNSTEPGPGCPDLDEDGIDDAHDPFLNDTDNDGLPNAWEEEHGLLNGSDDALGDPDGDGRTNIDEYYDGTDPNVFDEEPITNVTPDPGNRSNDSHQGTDDSLLDPADIAGFAISIIVAAVGFSWVMIRKRKMPHYLKMIENAEDMAELGSVWDEIKRKLDKGRILAQHGVVLKEAVDGRREELEQLWDEWDQPDFGEEPGADWFYENPGW